MNKLVKLGNFIKIGSIGRFSAFEHPPSSLSDYQIAADAVKRGSSVPYVPQHGSFETKSFVNAEKLIGHDIGKWSIEWAQTGSLKLEFYATFFRDRAVLKENNVLSMFRKQ